MFTHEILIAFLVDWIYPNKTEIYFYYILRIRN